MFGINTYWRTRVGQIWDSVGTWFPQSASQPFRVCPCLSTPHPQLSEFLTFAPPPHHLVPTPGAVAPRGATAMSLRSLCRSGLSRCPSSPRPPAWVHLSCQTFPSLFSPLSFFPRFSAAPVLCVQCAMFGVAAPCQKKPTQPHTHTHMQSQTHSWAPAARKDRGLEINEGERRKGERSLNKLALEKRRKMRRGD